MSSTKKTVQKRNYRRVEKKENTSSPGGDWVFRRNCFDIIEQLDEQSVIEAIEGEDSYNKELEEYFSGIEAAVNKKRRNKG